MPVLCFTPHLLSFLETRNGFEDDNGDWHPGTETWSDKIRCHAVPAGRANEITYEDGRKDYYTYVIGRLPRDFKDLKVGDRVKLFIGSVEREYTVKGFHRYQLQCKVWV